MEHRFLNLDDTTVWLDRLLQKESTTADLEGTRGLLYKQDAMGKCSQISRTSMDWNPVLPECHDEILPDPYQGLGLPNGLHSGYAGPESSLFDTRKLASQFVSFLPLEIRANGHSELLASVIGEEELELETLVEISDDSGHAGLEIHFLHAIQFLCSGFADSSVTMQEAVSVLGMENMKLLLLGAEVYSLVDGATTKDSWAERLWQHSLRVGYLARVIAESESADTETIRESCAAGMLHDLGILVLTNSFRDTYEAIRAKAQRNACPLAEIEQSSLGLSHGEIGAFLLRRWGVNDAILEAVAWHDEPFRTSTQGFSPLTAVYVANILDGGGWPQDGDGVPTDDALAYLTARGLADSWPKWQEWLTTRISSHSSI